LHKAFDLNFKPTSVDTQDQALSIKRIPIKEINMDLHVSQQMLLLYPDMDSESLIKEAVASFNKMAQKLSKISISKSLIYLFSNFNSFLKQISK
jgi:hypothetical protein